MPLKQSKTVYPNLFFMGNFVRTLVITFDTPIRHQEIPLFRGSILKSLGNQADILCHNHTGEGSLRYSYPLIQYKQIRGKAALVCVEEGVDIIGQFLTQAPETIIGLILSFGFFFLVGIFRSCS